jgi:flagellar basal body rod protein FlgB
MFKGLDRIEAAIGGLSSQHKVISNNVANSHTPGYVRQSYNFSDVLGHMSNPFETELSRKMGSMAGSTFAQGDGHPVNLAQELVDMQKVFLNYSMVSRRASTVFSNLRRATQIGR